MSRIEQLIDEIEEFVESCKPQPFSQTKIIVPKDELFELLTELRLKTPDEIKRYRKSLQIKIRSSMMPRLRLNVCWKKQQLIQISL